MFSEKSDLLNFQCQFTEYALPCTHTEIKVGTRVIYQLRKDALRVVALGREESISKSSHGTLSVNQSGNSIRCICWRWKWWEWEREFPILLYKSLPTTTVQSPCRSCLDSIKRYNEGCVYRSVVLSWNLGLGTSMGTTTISSESPSP